MLITGQPTPRQEVAAEDLHVAREDHEVDVGSPSSSSSIRASAAGFSPLTTGTCS